MARHPHAVPDTGGSQGQPGTHPQHQPKSFKPGRCPAGCGAPRSARQLVQQLAERVAADDPLPPGRGCGPARHRTAVADHHPDPGPDPGTPDKPQERQAAEIPRPIHPRSNRPAADPSSHHPNSGRGIEVSWPPGRGRRGRAAYDPDATVASRQARSSPYLLSCHEQASVVAGHRGAPRNRSSKPVMPSQPRRRHGGQTRRTYPVG